MDSFDALLNQSGSPISSDMLGMILFWSIAATVLVVVMMVINMLRKIRVDNAIIRTQKDVAEIKQLLASSYTQVSPHRPTPSIELADTKNTPTV